MKITKTNKRNPVKIILIVIIVLALLVGGWMVYARSTNKWPFATDASTNSTTDDKDTVNYEPLTDQEAQDGQEAKKRLQQEGEQSGSMPEQTNPGQKASINVGIAFADVTNGNLEIRAFTPSIITGDGACTATISKSGSSAITRTSKAFIDASSTICEPIYVPVSQLSSGTWTVDVTYTSPAHEGSSGPIKVEV